MRAIDSSESHLVSGGYYNQVLACVGGAVGGGLAYAQGSGSNGTVAGAAVSILGTCAAAVAGTVPGLGSTALTIGFFTSELANSLTPTTQEVQQGYRDTGSSCVPLGLTDMFRYRDSADGLSNLTGMGW